MRTAVCLTPDRKFFGAAVCAAEQIIQIGLPQAVDLLLVCEGADVWPRFADLNQRGRVKLLIVDFARFLPANLPPFAGSNAIYRRLVLDRVLPESYSRIVAIDSDTMATREGIGPLASIDLGPHTFAAGLDMIYCMEFGGPLAKEFRGHRRAIGLDADTPYLNSGVMVIDRTRWATEKLGARTIDLALSDKALHWIEQDALNILVSGNFAKLSPRWNFMGDFLLLDFEKEIAPVLYHFVNRPKPWQRNYAGEARFHRFYADWFARSPWPDFVAEPARPAHVPVNWAFRRELLSFLKSCTFADGWRA